MNINWRNESPKYIWEEKVGYDSANKRMVANVAPHLYELMEWTGFLPNEKPRWINVVRALIKEKNKVGKVNENGYYGTILRILKDIKVVESSRKNGLSKGTNWDRFFGDEDWSWFKASTWCGGHGEIVK